MLYTATTLVFCLALVGHTLADSKQCIPGLASYNETSGSCKCNQGYKGRGDLCCDDVNDWSNCNVGGDPWLSSYDGTQSALNFPCTGRIAVVNSKAANGLTCKVEAWLASRVVDKGAIYPDGMTVAYTIGNGDKMLFKFVKGTLQRPSDDSPQTARSMARTRSRTAVQGESININFDFIRQIWTMSGCGTKIAFRAVQDNRAVHTTSRPGVCFSVVNGADAKPTKDIAEGDLCSVSSSYSPQGSLATDLLSHLVGDLVNIGITAQAVHPDYRDVCNNLGTVARSSCNTNLAGPAQKCASFFYNSVVRSCLDLKGASGPQMVEWFTKCLDHQCNPNPARCASLVSSNAPLKTCIPSLCDL